MAAGLRKNEEYKMAKYTGPKNKLSRREGTDLLLKVVIDLTNQRRDLKTHQEFMVQEE